MRLSSLPSGGPERTAETVVLRVPCEVLSNQAIKSVSPGAGIPPVNSASAPFLPCAPCYTPPMPAACPSPSPRGFFLTLEGPDGSGKSTQLRRLAACLESQGHPIVVTRQPGGTPLGDRIRSLILDSRTQNLAPLAELGLMFSDRAQSLAQIIRPALEQGRIVLCDRYTDSTEAYQGGGRQLGSEIVLRMHQVMCGGLDPDLTILLLADFDRSLARARRRNHRAASAGTNEGRFEGEQEDFHRRVHLKYREIAAREPHRVTLIEGDQSIEAIHQQIVALVESRLAAHRASPATAS